MASVRPESADGFVELLPTARRAPTGQATGRDRGARRLTRRALAAVAASRLPSRRRIVARLLLLALLATGALWAARGEPVPDDRTDAWDGWEYD
jgi:hypothetical protein